VVIFFPCFALVTCFPTNDSSFMFSLLTIGYIACERRRIYGCRLSPPKNNVYEPEPGNDSCDVMTFVSLWPIRFHDTMKLGCSWQRIPRAVALGLLELNCDWLKIPTSQKSFPGSGSQTLFFGGDKRHPEIRLRSQATGYMFSHTTRITCFPMLTTDYMFPHT